MRKEYDLGKLKGKRRGMLPELQEKSAAPIAKVRITIALDEDVLAHFKKEAEKPGGLPYQTQINQALRLAAQQVANPTSEAVKAALLHDRDFITALAAKVKGRKAA